MDAPAPMAFMPPPSYGVPVAALSPASAPSAPSPVAAMPPAAAGTAAGSASATAAQQQPLDSGYDDDDDDDESVYLSLVVAPPAIGVAVYSVQATTLAIGQCLSGVSDEAVSDTISAIKGQLGRIRAIVTTSKSTEAALASMARGPGQGEGGRAASDAGGGGAVSGSSEDAALPVRILKASDFGFALGQRLIQGLRVLDLEDALNTDVSTHSAGMGGFGIMSGGTATDKRMLLDAVVDLEDVVSVCAAAGLINFLTKNNLASPAQRASSTPAVSPLAAAPTGFGDHVTMPEAGAAGPRSRARARATARKSASSASDTAGSRALTVASILRFSASSHLVMDTVTFKALDIFAVEQHPSRIKGVGREKEGFSLYTLLDSTMSPGGRRMLREWMLRPRVQCAEIIARQDAVAFICEPMNAEHVDQVSRYLRKVKDAGRLVTRIKMVRATPANWVSLHDTVVNAVAIREILSLMLNVPAPSVPGAGAAAAASAGDTRVRIALLDEIVDSVGSTVQRTREIIEDFIDIEETRATGELFVRSGKDAQLDEHRAIHAKLHSFLTTVSAQELERSPSLSSLSVRYIPQVGCVAVVDREDNGTDTEGYVEPVGWRLQYRTQVSLVYKSDKTDELDDFFGDIKSFISDKEGELVREAEGKLLSHGEVALRRMGDALARLDVLIALAHVAIDRDFRRPSVNDGREVAILNGRHPLQELAVETFVPNDALITAERGKGVCIITGPNGSGKSCACKMVGVIVFLAQIGSFVPAEAASIGIVDQIFTRVRSLESNSLAQSSFTIDSMAMSAMLRNCTERSLLLIDEYGKGTSSVDGLSLLAASIKYVATGAATAANAAAGSEAVAKVGEAAAVGDPRVAVGDPSLCPRTIVTTHFRELVEYNLLEGVPNVQFFVMDTMTQSEEEAVEAAAAAAVAPVLFGAAPGGGTAWEGAGADAGRPTRVSLVPLFKLKPGVTDSSYGVHCARAAGVDAAVLARSEQVLHCRSAGARIPMPVSSAEQADADARLMEALSNTADWREATPAALRRVRELIAAAASAGASSSDSAGAAAPAR